MIIVGGTYREYSQIPHIDRLGGSGIRAALVARALGARVEVVTAAAASEQVAVASTYNGFGIAHTIRERTLPVTFSYFHPLDTPAIEGRDSGLSDLTPVVGDDVVVFGMIEGRPSSCATRVVVDPQQPLGLQGNVTDNIECDHAALVLNRYEAASLSGSHDPNGAAQALIASQDVDVVVVKNGARGAIVATTAGTDTISVCWSDSVAPLGTGDCFTAAFATAWFAGAEPVEAAQHASACTAQYTATSALEPPAFDPAAPYPVPINSAGVYLAGPFFTLAERWQIELCRNILEPHVFSPFHDVGPGGSEVAEADIDGLNNCDAVFAIVEGDDPGTLYEAGYAAALGLPVIAYALHPDTEGAKMIMGLGGELHDDLATALYRAQWHAMEHADVNR